MKVILCRLGVFILPHYIQKRWFERTGITGLFPVSKKHIAVSEEEIKKYKKEDVSYLTGYYHYYKTRQYDDNCHDYAYLNVEELKFIQKYEKEYYFSSLILNEKNPVYLKISELLHRPIYLDDDNRTNPILIDIVEDYCKNCKGEHNKTYGTHAVRVVEIPDDVEWEVDEPEGCNEIIREKHRVWGMNS